MGGQAHAFVTGLGVVCAGAADVPALRRLLAKPRRLFAPATVFPCKAPGAGLPVAEVQCAGIDAAPGALPRTHQLACKAAREAIGTGPPPDAMVLGTTTGGILTTEAALEAGFGTPEPYRHHGLDTVSAVLAADLVVRGPVLTVSTACSSAAVALSVAQALLRAGLAERVLVGGVDSLSRLTFHGFRQLQLIDPEGARPLDQRRAGMTVGEGAGFLLLESRPGDRLVHAVLAGTGLSCDAYHATSPRPDGAGAVLAIQRALDDAGVEPGAIDYVNLHGTGTPDNDAAEARALHEVFPGSLPALSSTKGLTGHALAAAGAIEAVISVLALEDGLVPANTGLGTVDAALGLAPVLAPTRAPLATVLTSSFGFGGNNACAIFRAGHASDSSVARPTEPSAPPALRVAGSACLTARGDASSTWQALADGEVVAGFVSDALLAQSAPAAFIRRLKRLPRMGLALARAALAAGDITGAPGFIAFGTAWGPLAETWDFLRKLFESDDQFSSPMDFIGSVHNAPAGQVALLLGANAPNLTLSSGDRSFAQSLLCASLAISCGAPNALVLAAEGFEPHLSPRLDPAGGRGPLASDGGAALALVLDDGAPGARVRWLGELGGSDVVVLDLVDALAKADGLDRFDAVTVGIPSALASVGSDLLSGLSQRFHGRPVVRYRDRLGQHASVGATCAVLTARATIEGTLALAPTRIPLPRRRVLMLEAGPHASAIEVFA
jgi:3-oxoacyl-(acyl-carrier-protein) synthase